MTIDVFSLKCPKNKVNKIEGDSNDNKDYVKITTLTGYLRDSSSIVDPDIEIANAGVIAGNYFYIHEFGRFYFLRDDPVKYANLTVLQLHTDVLKSFAASLLGSPCIIAKNSYRYNMFLNDDEFKAESNPIFNVYKYPRGFDLSNAKFVLGIIGDKVTV